MTFKHSCQWDPPERMSNSVYLCISFEPLDLNRFLVPCTLIINVAVKLTFVLQRRGLTHPLFALLKVVESYFLLSSSWASFSLFSVKLLQAPQTRLFQANSSQSTINWNLRRARDYYHLKVTANGQGNEEMKSVQLNVICQWQRRPEDEWHSAQRHCQKELVVDIFTKLLRMSIAAVLALKTISITYPSRTAITRQLFWVGYG
jgi:hypothetical protein